MKLIFLIVTQMFWLFMGTACTSTLSLFPLSSPKQMDRGWASCEGTQLGQLILLTKEIIPTSHVTLSSKSLGKGCLSLWHLSCQTATNVNGALLSRKLLKSSYQWQVVNKFLILLCLYAAVPVKLSISNREFSPSAFLIFSFIPLRGQWAKDSVGGYLLTGTNPYLPFCVLST